METKLKLAFTLIELLVVIAIIGILSGLVIVGINGMTNSANIAKAQVFSNSLRNALMTGLVSEWKLNGDAIDSWAGNNGTLYGTAHWRTSPNCVYDGCFEFNGVSNDCFLLSGDVVLGGSFTVSFWAYRDTNNTYDMVLGNINDSQKIGFSVNSDKLFMRVLQGGTLDNTSSDDTKTNQWIFVVITRNSSNIVYSYINAGVAKVSFSGAAQSGNYTINRIGKDTLNYFDGKVDEIRIFSETIPISQIRQNYYSGLNNLLMSGQINRGEYEKRALDLNNRYAKK